MHGPGQRSRDRQPQAETLAFGRSQRIEQGGADAVFQRRAVVDHADDGAAGFSREAHRDDTAARCAQRVQAVVQ